MSTYEELKGLKVKYLSSDTSGDRTQEGEVFYNSSDFNIKSFLASAAWHSGANLGTGRYALAQGTGGTVDAAIAIFGRSTTAKTEEYNGTGWAAGGDGNTARYGGAKFGTQTAAVAAGGKNGGNKDDVEEYDGSSWTEVNDYTGTDRAYLAGFGILTAGVICGGVTASPDTWYDLTEEYDGTNWTNGGALNTARATHGTTGTLTAGLTFGGYSPSLLAKTEEYNGTAWTESGDMNTARSHLAGSGTQTEALAYGGLTPPSTTATEAYDGSTWSTSSATLGTATARHSSAGSAANTGLVFGGNPPGVTTTQEFTLSLTATTGAAWSSGGNMNTARGGTNGAAGDKAAGVTFGGQVPPGRSNATEEYDGSSWTSVTNTPQARRTYLVTGTQTASLLCGGQPPTPTANGDAETFEYDGTNFTDTGDINNQRDNAAGAGTQTAGLAVGGRTRPGSSFVPNTNVEEYNGSSWTAVNALPAANASSTSATGPQTAAIFATASPAYAASYDGTNWTAITAGQQIPSSYSGTGAAGTSSSNAYMGGGEEPGGTRHGALQYWNGTSWLTAPSFATARNSFGFTGASTAMLICGGQGDPGHIATTEEFTAESTATRAVKTIDFD